jgi:hypothetical protein
LSSLAKRGAQLASDNSPLILTAFGVVGTVTTAVLAGKAAIRAYDFIQYEEESRSRHNTKVGELQLEPLTDREKFVYSWKYFVPAGLSLVGTVACIICANQIGTRRTAALAAAYSLSERAATEYKDKVVEHFGKTKAQKVEDELQQDRMDRNPVSSQRPRTTGGGNDLCYERFTDRYFYSSMETIKQAMNRINYDINQGVYASLSDFYAYLGLGPTGVSDELGWNGDHLMEITFSTTVSDDNRPCIAFDYHVEPVRNYFRVH